MLILDNKGRNQLDETAHNSATARYVLLCRHGSSIKSKVAYVSDRGKHFNIYIFRG